MMPLTFKVFDWLLLVQHVSTATVECKHTQTSKSRVFCRCAPLLCASVHVITFFDRLHIRNTSRVISLNHQKSIKTL
ncbi:hypothetical protein DFH28DRAFT_967535 [Melampsora americana]|nr:hypothetical protein DFH28DRAFT_967535 [Melampsora americana]